MGNAESSAAALPPPQMPALPPPVCTTVELVDVCKRSNTAIPQEMQTTFDYLSAQAAVLENMGVTAEELCNRINALFRRLEIPIGLLSKLRLLCDMDWLEFLIDDSGSMDNGPSGEYETRFAEAEARLCQMLEALSLLPVKLIKIRFLNRSNNTDLRRVPRMPPDELLAAWKKAVKDCFAKGPNGGTPLRTRIEQSFAQSTSDKKIARYVFCDGQPDGGSSDVRAISALLISRSNPRMNPVTFISCTEVDSDVEWMKDVEKVAPFVAESDDFKTAMSEVRKNQGWALPYNKGLYLIAGLVAAMCPDDLDALDECVPLTKTSHDAILGYSSSDGDYRRYWDGFIVAQRARAAALGWSPKRSTQYQATFNWEPVYGEFCTKSPVRLIGAVQQFQRELAALVQSE
jgi:hypothetical protein